MNPTHTMVVTNFFSLGFAQFNNTTNFKPSINYMLHSLFKHMALQKIFYTMPMESESVQHLIHLFSLNSYQSMQEAFVTSIL